MLTEYYQALFKFIIITVPNKHVFQTLKLISYEFILHLTHKVKAYIVGLLYMNYCDLWFCVL